MNRKNPENCPIGIFDSGVGGLTVLREIEKLMPCEDIVYFGDTARVPYGNKSTSTVRKFSTSNILFLLEQNVKMVMVACNTSSALCLDYLNNIFRIPVIGVIAAGAAKAVEASSGKIGIIGTSATVESKSYEYAIARFGRKFRIYSQSCPLFVPLVEEGVTSGEIVQKTIEMYLSGLKKRKIDTLILGCTHYPLLKKEIRAFLKNVDIIDSAREAACHTKEILDHFRLRKKSKKPGKKKYYISDEPKTFLKLAKYFLQRPVPRPRIINV